MAELTHLVEILDRTDLRHAMISPQPGPPELPKGRRGVPAGRMGDTFANFRESPAMAAAYAQCLMVSALQARCALLAGSYGNGKTHLAIAALRAYDDLRTGWFWKVPDFLTMIKRRVFDEGEPVEAVLEPWGDGRLMVVFDDLGAENRTEWASEQLYRVLDARYDSKAPTIITTNVLPEQIDGRIFSRYREGLVLCMGADER